MLAATKVDDQRREAEAASMWNLGLGQPWPVSGLHGRGTGDLLDALLEVLPEAPKETFEAENEGATLIPSSAGSSVRRPTLATSIIMICGLPDSYDV